MVMIPFKPWGILDDTPVMNIDRSTPVPRCKENIPVSITVSFGNVLIRTYKKPETPGPQQSLSEDCLCLLRKPLDP